MTDTIIDFIRHGEPEGGRCFRGHNVDDPLSEKGWEQMWAAVDETPAWTHIVSSPLQRCRQFAEAMTERYGIPVSVDDRFKEVGFGGWEGQSPEMIQQQDAEAYAAFYRDPVKHRPAGAESWEHFSARVAEALDEVGANLAGRHVLVVAHAGVIRAAVATVLSASAGAAYRIKVENAGLTRFRVNDGIYHLEYLNRMR